jgi:hypothetical protein
VGGRPKHGLEEPYDVRDVRYFLFKSVAGLAPVEGRGDELWRVAPPGSGGGGAGSDGGGGVCVDGQG